MIQSVTNVHHTKSEQQVGVGDDQERDFNGFN